MQEQGDYTLDLRQFSHSEDEGIILAIKRDHDAINFLFLQYLKETLPEIREMLTNEIIRQLCIHSIAEEIVIYPIIKEKMGQALFDECLSDHNKLKKDLSELSNTKLDVEAEGFYYKLTNMLKDFVGHSSKEDGSIMPCLAGKLTKEEEMKATKAFLEKRYYVPTRPHPNVPDTQPAENLIASLVAPADKILDRSTRRFPKIIR